MLIVLIGCAPASQKDIAKPEGSANKLPAPSLEKIAEGVWVHKSYETIEPYGSVLSQGLVIVENDQAIIIDSAWNNADTELIIDLVREDLNATPVLAIPTHAHADKMGGLAEFKKAGIDTVAYDLTNEDAVARGFEAADRSFLPSFTFGKITAPDAGDPPTLNEGPNIEVFFPGEGHTRDNIVVYVPSAKVIFGGCLIRPGSASTMGNTADGNVDTWAASVRAVADAFPDAEIVVPSHGKAAGRELLDHTIQLAEAHLKASAHDE